MTPATHKHNNGGSDDACCIVVPAIGSFCHFTVQSSQDESDNAVMAAIFYLFDPNMLPNCIVT